MDMKKILQAMDGASKPAVKADDDMKRFVSIISEAAQVSPRFAGVQQTQDDDGSTTTDYQAGPIAVTQKVDSQGRPIKSTAQYDLGVGKLGAEQDHVSGIRTTTATPADPNVDPNALLPTNAIAANKGVDPKRFAKFQQQNPASVKETSIARYFKEVEQELLESTNQVELKKKTKAAQLAERAIKEVGGNYGHHSNIKRHVAQSKRPPDHIVQMAKSGARVDNNRRFSLEDTEGTDSVSLDIPLLIRLFEFAREDAKDDMTLHTVAEKLIALSKNGQTLSMDQYDAIIGKDTVSEDSDPCWKDYKQVGMKKKGNKTVPNCVPKK